MQDFITSAEGIYTFVAAGRGGSYFSPPWIGLMAIHVDHGGLREPSNSLARDEQAWSKLYLRTIDIVNTKLAAQRLPEIQPL